MPSLFYVLLAKLHRFIRTFKPTKPLAYDGQNKNYSLVADLSSGIDMLQDEIGLCENTANVENDIN